MDEINFRQLRLREETAPIRARILEKLAGLPWDGLRFKHNIPGLSLYRIVAPAGPFASVSDPMVSVIIKGSKRVHVAQRTLVNDESCYFLSAVGLPMTAHVCDAKEGEPYVAASLRLDLEKLRRIIADHDIHAAAAPEGSLVGVAVGTATPELFDAFLRLISLADAPTDIPFLAHHIHNEILYRLLTGAQGAQLRRFALVGTNSNRVAKAIAWLKENYARPLRVEELAEIANMGVSTLHHHFRAMTAMSPLQFQKHLRLHHARELMLSEQLDAATAASRVGYESPTQFSREYRRAFGHPPLRDIKALLNSGNSTGRETID